MAWDPRPWKAEHVVSVNQVWTDEALDARPLVKWLRNGGKGPRPALVLPPLECPPVEVAKEKEPGTPLERPDPAPEGQCALCFQTRPLIVTVAGGEACGSCAMEGVDRDRLGEVLEEERKPAKRTWIPASERRGRQGNSLWTSGEVF